MKIQESDFDDFYDGITTAAPEVVPFVKDTSFDSLQSNISPKSTIRRLILREEQIDRFCVKRTRVELTPSMCIMPHCKYDAASKWGGWQFVPDTEKTVVLDVLRKHKEYHSVNEELIVAEDKLDTEWLKSAQGI